MATNKELITAEELRKVLFYDPETGAFTWLQSTAYKIYRGMPAGTGSRDKYSAIRIFGVLYDSHRLAFLYMTGEWPRYEVDHINGDGRDNRWENLRDVTHSENSLNHHTPSRSSTGYRGVYPMSSGRFQAKADRNSRRYTIGVFDTIEEALAAREEFIKTLTAPLST